MGISAIGTLETDNFGGGCFLLIADRNWIDAENFPEIINHNYEGSILLLDGYAWQRFDFTEQTINLKSTKVEESGKEGYQNILTAIAPKDRLSLQQKLSATTIKRAIVIYYDANGYAKVIGSYEDPARLIVDGFDHGTERYDRNEYSISINYKHTIPLPFYQYIPDNIEDGDTTPDPTVIEDPTPGGDSEVEYVLESKIVMAGASEAEWSAWGGILKKGQIAISTDTSIAGFNIYAFKIGNGVDTWDDLTYLNDALAATPQTLADILSNGNKVGGLAITSDDEGAYLELIDENTFNLVCSTGAITNTSDRMNILHQTSIELDAPAVKLPQETEDHAVYLDGDKALRSSATTATELGYVHGVTGPIQDQLDNKLDASAYIPHYRGKYNSESALIAAIPSGNDGDYAIVNPGAGSDAIEYIWDSEDGWVPGSGLSSPVTTDEITEGSTNLYFTAARVRATVLTGLSLLTSTAVTATDSILVAIGKLQKQINDLTSVITGKFSKSGDTMTGAIIQKDSNIAGSSIDWSLGNKFYKTLSADVTFTFSNDANGEEIEISITQGASPYAVTWPAVTWNGGVTPEQATDNGIVTIYKFTKMNGVIYGSAGSTTGTEVDLAIVNTFRFLTNN